MTDVRQPVANTGPHDDRTRRQRIEDSLAGKYDDRVIVVEDQGVWVSGMNANCGRIARSIADHLMRSGFIVDLVRDDDAVQHGGLFVPVEGYALRTNGAGNTCYMVFTDEGNGTATFAPDGYTGTMPPMLRDGDEGADR